MGCGPSAVSNTIKANNEAINGEQATSEQDQKKEFSLEFATHVKETLVGIAEQITPMNTPGDIDHKSLQECFKKMAKVFHNVVLRTKDKSTCNETWQYDIKEHLKVFESQLKKSPDRLDHIKAEDLNDELQKILDRCKLMEKPSDAIIEKVKSFITSDAVQLKDLFNSMAYWCSKAGYDMKLFIKSENQNHDIKTYCDYAAIAAGSVPVVGSLLGKKYFPVLVQFLSYIVMLVLKING